MLPSRIPLATLGDCSHTMGQLLSTFLEKYLKVDGATVLSCADFNVREMKSITYATVSDLTNLEMAFDIPLTGNGILDHSSISPPQHGGSSGRATRSESKKTTPDSGGSLLDHTKSAGEMTIPRDYSMWT